MAKRDDPGRFTAVSKKYGIAVGNFHSPELVASEWLDVCVINVSDSMTDQCDYWFPINEVAPWSYAPFYWFKKLADREHEAGRKILVHCHAGIHRSKMMAYFWLLSRRVPVTEAMEELQDDDLARCAFFDMEKGFIPKDILNLYTIMDANPTWSLQGCLRELGVKQLLTNSSPKTWWEKVKTVFSKYDRSW